MLFLKLILVSLQITGIVMLLWGVVNLVKSWAYYNPKLDMFYVYFCLTVGLMLTFGISYMYGAWI